LDNYVLNNYIAAVLRLERTAEADYSADELPHSFPQFRLRHRRIMGTLNVSIRNGRQHLGRHGQWPAP
jgi:hypothetical protein